MSREKQHLFYLPHINKAYEVFMRINLQNYYKSIISELNEAAPLARAQLRGSAAHDKIWGEILFYQTTKGVVVVSEVHNLPDTETNIFAEHIHSGKVCEGDFGSALGHYNPNNTEHPNHAGDLPPLFSNNGFAWSAVLTSRFCIDKILGLTVIIHDQPDDFHSQPAGNSGERIACGIIKLTKETKRNF